MLSVQGLSTLRGFLTERYESAEYVVSLDAFSLGAVPIGEGFLMTRDVAMRIYDQTINLESIVECGICVDFTSDTVHG